MREPFTMFLSEGRRNDELGQLSTQDLGTQKSENTLGRGVEFTHDPASVDRDDTVERSFEDGAIDRFELVVRVTRPTLFVVLRVDHPCLPRGTGVESVTGFDHANQEQR